MKCLCYSRSALVLLMCMVLVTLPTLKLQKALSKETMKETLDSQCKMTSSQTAMPIARSARTWALARAHVTTSKTHATAAHPLETAIPDARMQAESESQLLETAACGAVMSFCHNAGCVSSCHEKQKKEQIASLVCLTKQTRETLHNSRGLLRA